jgi:hypothetical protein
MSRARDLWNLMRGLTVLLALWTYRLARCALAWLLLDRWLGPAGATLLIALLLWWRLTWIQRLAACIGLIMLWHWPWWLAPFAAAPRLLLVLPGFITAQLARVRHPRPLWPAPFTATATSVPGTFSARSAAASMAVPAKPRPR